VYVFIVNPVAGNGRAEQILPHLTAEMKNRGLQWRVLKTTRPGDGTDIAASMAEETIDGVIAVGGDGTFSEVSAGLAGGNIPMIFVPCGTGNDFVKTAALPKDPLKALKIQLDAPVGRIDMGRVNGHYFLNVSGTGLDVDALLETEKHKKSGKGLKPYLLGVKDAISGYKPVKALISYDDEPMREDLFTILSIGNGCYIGGGMHAVPGAVLNDGLFDVVQIRPVKKWMIAILMLLFIPGLHVKTSLAICRKVKKLRIRRKNMVLNLDGELIPCEDAMFEITEDALPVRLPCCAVASSCAQEKTA